MYKRLIVLFATLFLLAGCGNDGVPTPQPLDGRWSGEVGTLSDNTVDYLSIDVLLDQTVSQVENDSAANSAVTVRIVTLLDGGVVANSESIDTNTRFVSGSYTAPNVTLSMDVNTGTIEFSGTLSGSSLTGTATATLPDGNGGEVVETFDITLNKQ